MSATVIDAEAGPVIFRQEDVWILRLPGHKKAQEYRCATEAQARALAMVLTSTAPK